VCLTAGIHGDEINGIEIARRVAYALDPEALRGTVISVPVVNVFGYTRSSRYLPDRRDLNRFFPGSRFGSVASRIAYAFFDGVVRHCDSLVDLHTGSFDRMNLPQLRADLTDPGVLAFVRGFSDTVVLHSPGSRGMLRTAAVSAGIPAVTFEVGGPARLQPAEIDVAVAAVERLLEHQGLTGALAEAEGVAGEGAAGGEGVADGAEAAADAVAQAGGVTPTGTGTAGGPAAGAADAPPHDPLGAAVEASASQPIFFESRWVRANDGGLLISQVELGQRVRPGEVLGRVVDPMDNRQTDIRAPFFGRVIGMAQNQQVLPGFAAYHLGEETSEARAVEEAGTAPAPDAEVEAEAEDGSASLEPEEGDG
jgi:predicted deacylase